MAFTSLGVVLISTMTFVLGTFPEFQSVEESGREQLEYPTVKFAMDIIDNIAVVFFLIEYTVMHMKYNIVAIECVQNNRKRVSYFFDTELTIHFYLQIRFACSPRKFQFFIGPMNLVDLFAILPFFLDLIIGGLQVRSKY